jgi:putative membrane protein
MNERLRFIVAGFFVGLAEILPGISGSTIAIAFNVYQKFILFLSNLKISNLSLKYKELNRVFFLDLIIPFLFSMALTVILLSNLIMFLFSEYTYYFLVFLGSLMCLIAFVLLNRIKDLLNNKLRIFFYFSLGAVFGFLLNQINIIFINPNFIVLLVVGFIAFSFFLMPGISGSAVLLSIGVYELIIGSIATLNMTILIPFALGCLISLLTMPKIVHHLLDRFNTSIMTFFSGLILVSGILLFPFFTL